MMTSLVSVCYHDGNVVTSHYLCLTTFFFGLSRLLLTRRASLVSDGWYYDLTIRIQISTRLKGSPTNKTARSIRITPIDP
jgi:hypothetical protein